MPSFLCPDNAQFTVLSNASLRCNDALTQDSLWVDISDSSCFLTYQDIQLGNVDISSCTNTVSFSTEEFQSIINSNFISSTDIAEIWMWGFASILIPWAITYAALWAQKSIKALG